MRQNQQVKTPLEQSFAYLKGKQIKDWRLSAEEIFTHFLKIKKNELFIYLEKEKNIKISKILEKQIFKGIERRAQREPLQYILKTWPFYNVNLELSPSVLIPRFETEYLVDLIVKRLKKGKEQGKIKEKQKKSNSRVKGKVLWDIGTGSGALAIALKKVFPELKVIASDVSQKALKIAKRNAVLNQVKIEFRHGNLFDPFLKQKEKADFIVSNPPYVSEKEYAGLEKEVFFEPERALVGGKDGLLFYRRIADNINLFLKEGGELFLEMGESQGDKVRRIFSKKDFTKTRILQDLEGKERFFFVELQ